MDTFELGKISPLALISEDAQIGAGVTIGAYTIVHAGVQLGDGSVVGSHCSLGEPAGTFYNDADAIPKPCIIGKDATIRSFTIIYEDTTIGSLLKTGHQVIVREGTTIGEDVQIGTMCELHGDSEIGNHVRMHSNISIGRMSHIGDFVWLYPYVGVTNDPHPPSDTCTVGVTIKPFAVLAAHVLIMPGIVIGEHAFIGARSTVTRDIPAEAFAFGEPAKVLGSVRDIKCKHGNLEHIYPWPRQFRRGYPEGVLPPASDFEIPPELLNPA